MFFLFVFVCFFGFCWYIEREEELLGVWVYKYKEMYVCMCVMHWMLQKEGVGWYWLA